MQWNTAANAGFSQKAPWLPVPPSYQTHNVASEAKDSNSVLSLYKKVLALRHTNVALIEGAYSALNEDDVNVMSYLRSYKGKTVLVALNMSAAPQKASFNLSGHGLPSFSLRPLVASGAASVKGAEVMLEPFGLMVAEVNP
jgi:glycosidase